MHSLEGRRALVLGASGFVGRWVVEELVARGAAVGRHVRASTFTEDLVADLLVDGSAADLVRAFRPDVVFDCAGYGVAKDERDPRCFQRINVGVVAELIEALGSSPSDWPGLRLVVPGSALEYGAEATSLDESAECHPTTPYGEAKLAATRLVDAARDAGLPCSTARLFTVFGPGERPGRLVPTLLAAASGTEPIPLSAGTQARDWTYVEDVARGLADLACSDADDVLARRYPFDAAAINFASGVLTSVRNFVEALAVPFGIDPERLSFGEVPGLAEEMFHPPVPTERLRAALGWTPPTDPAPGLARLHERVRESRG